MKSDQERNKFFSTFELITFFLVSSKLINALWTVHGADVFREESTETFFSLFASSSDFDKMAVIKPRHGRPQITKLWVQMCPLTFSLKILFSNTSKNSGEITLG